MFEIVFYWLPTFVAKLLSLPPQPPHVNCWHDDLSGELNHLGATYNESKSRNKIPSYHLMWFPLHGPGSRGRLQGFDTFEISLPSSSVFKLSSFSSRLSPFNARHSPLHRSSDRKLLVFPAQPPYSKVSQDSCFESQKYRVALVQAKCGIKIANMEMDRN